MSWMVLESYAQWEKYKNNVAKAFRADVDLVAWGNDPEQYPCLVSTVLQESPDGNIKCISAFVYRDAAKALLRAGKKQVDGQNPKQAQYNRWMAAHMLTIAGLLRDTGICKEAVYEDKFLEALDVVDGYIKDERGKTGLLDCQNAVLDTLRPPN